MVFCNLLAYVNSCTSSIGISAVMKSAAGDTKWIVCVQLLLFLTVHIDSVHGVITTGRLAIELVWSMLLLLLLLFRFLDFHLRNFLL